MPITPLCACPGDTEYTLLQKLNNNLIFVLRSIYPSFSGVVVNMSNCPCTSYQILQAINANLVAFAAAFVGASQRGQMALVNGQQSYDIVFPTPFAAAPGFIEATVQMVSSSGEIFFANVDYSTLTANGVTVWLNAAPTAASAGSYLNWLAIP